MDSVNSDENVYHKSILSLYLLCAMSSNCTHGEKCPKAGRAFESLASLTQKADIQGLDWTFFYIFIYLVVIALAGTAGLIGINVCEFNER